MTTDVALLLDSHALLWWLADLPMEEGARTRISKATIVYVSAASLWEIGIKKALGKLEIDLPLAPVIVRAGFRELPITSAHAEAAAALPPLHRDPFDRMLIAQSRIEGAPIVTRDGAFDGYEVSTVTC